MKVLDKKLLRGIWRSRGQAIAVTLEEDVDISGPAPPESTVEVDIKPGSDPNSINLSCHGVIPVAILTTEDFDAATVDPATVAFAAVSPKHSALEDVDHDGDVDLILHFRCQQVDIEPDATEACLEGETYDGQQVVGCDSVRIVPPHSPTDSDGDGFTDAVEACMGTNLWDNCPDDPSDDAWPPDIAVNTVVDVTDALLFLAAFPSAYSETPNYSVFPSAYSATSAYSQRLDLVGADGVIDVTDALRFLAHYPSACTNP